MIQEFYNLKLNLKPIHQLTHERRNQENRDQERPRPQHGLIQNQQRFQLQAERTITHALEIDEDLKQPRQLRAAVSCFPREKYKSSA